MKQHTCCVTGHRVLSEAQGILAERKILDEVAFALEDGYTRFLSGFARGTDLIFANIVSTYKRRYPAITLEAAIPYRARLECKDPEFQRLIKLCDRVTVLSEKYDPGVFERRNRWMIAESLRLIAVHDLRTTGGTVGTLLYAEKQGLEIREIFLV